MHHPEQTDKSSLNLVDRSTLNVETMLTGLLDFVCANTVWEYGELWFPQGQYSILELHSTGALNPDLNVYQADTWTQFQLCCKGFILGFEEGLPGRVWQSQQPEWIEDASIPSETYFLRNQIAKVFSVKAGLGVPLKVNSEMLAIAVFFSSKTCSQNNELIEQTQAAIAKFTLDRLA